MTTSSETQYSNIIQADSESLKQTPNPGYQYPWMFLDCLQKYLNIIKKKKIRTKLILLPYIFKFWQSTVKPEE